MPVRDLYFQKCRRCGWRNEQRHERTPSPSPLPAHHATAWDGGKNRIYDAGPCLDIGVVVEWHRWGTVRPAQKNPSELQQWAQERRRA